MFKKMFLTIAIVLTLSWGQSLAQYHGQFGCGYGSGNNVSCLQSVGLGGLYSSNCGRKVTTQEAAGLWSNYCNDDCSFNGGCGCGLFNGCRHGRLHGGCSTGCGFQNDGGMGCDNGGCADYGCDAGTFGQGLGCARSHRCRLFRGLFSRLGSGCSCYQGCFGYPGNGCCGGGCGNSFGCRGNIGCGNNIGCDGGFGCGSGCGHGCGLFRKLRGMTNGFGSHFRGVVRGVKQFACGCRGHLGGCRLFRGCIHRVGCTGFNGGYFYDAPITTSDNFGFYSAGCGCENQSNENCDSYQQGLSSHTHNPNCGGCSMQTQSQTFDQPPVVGPANNMNSLSPVGEMVPGQVIENSADGS